MDSSRRSCRRRRERRIGELWAGPAGLANCGQVFSMLWLVLNPAEW
jgi:hypothetical protein